MEELEKHLLSVFTSSTFNQCEHQLLPHMTGKPLEIRINEMARPYAIHMPAQILAHWAKVVKANLARDIELGVLEKLEVNNHTDWCTRMHIVAKVPSQPDMGLRRTVDFQELNKVSARQTHHKTSPFTQASRVPRNQLMLCGMA